MDREDVHDENISPLMDQIIEICQKHEIPMVASFHIPTDEHPDLSCTTALTSMPETPHIYKVVEMLIFNNLAYGILKVKESLTDTT